MSKTMTTAILSAAVATGVALFSPPAAAADILEQAWRARLVTLAPACGLRDAAWATALQQAVSQDVFAELPTVDSGLFGVRYHPKNSIDQLQAALAAAEAEGVRAFTRDKVMACKALATPDMLAKADEEAADAADDAKAAGSYGSKQWPATAILESASTRQFWLAETAGEATTCHLRHFKFDDDTDEVRSIVTSAIELAHESLDGIDRPDVAIDLAEYAGERIAALTPGTCSALRRSAELKALDAATKTYRADPNAWISRLTPLPDSE